MSSTIKEWPTKKRSLNIRVDPLFKKFIEKEYPGVTDPERTRRILDKLLYGRKK